MYGNGFIPDSLQNLANLCDKHKRAALPSPTSQVCLHPECVAERETGETTRCQSRRTEHYFRCRLQAEHEGEHDFGF